MLKDQTEFKLWVISAFLLFASVCFAGKVSSPPPFPNADKNLQFYLKELQANIHVLEVVTTSPNGSRNGDAGTVLLYNSSGTYYIAVNIDSGTVWSGVQVTALP